jgi:hypothetical protein
MTPKSKSSRSAKQSVPGLSSFALGAIAATSEGDGSDSSEIRFLRAHLEAAADKTAWPRALAAYLLDPNDDDAPLIGLADRMGLNQVELLAIALAAAVETDMMAGRAIAHVQAPVGGSRPSVGLIGSAFAPLAVSGSPIENLLTGAAVQSGMLSLLNEGSPVCERPVSVPLALCLALRGHDSGWPGVTLGHTPPTELPTHFREDAERHATALASGGTHALTLRSSSALEGRSVAGAIAEALGRRPLFIESMGSLTGLGPYLILRNLLPVFCVELAPAERKTLPALAGYDGPKLALCGPEGSVDFGGEPAGNWVIEIPGREGRASLWRSATDNSDLADQLAKHHRHGFGRIAHLARLAQDRAVLAGRNRIEAEDVWSASWIAEGAGLEALAQPLRDKISDDALVTTPNLRRDLERLRVRCLWRDGLADVLGVSAVTRYRPGVLALFTGPSGTGKTLAAGWLATRLALPLYRVDLASVTSKYVGETEKNLAQLLARAEQAEVVLLFDEADSMFARRTEVRDANDRFANAQTNYLLQRLETFDGIAILTSNSRARFDSAFARRLDVAIEFPLPGPQERRAIWESHLGRAHELTVSDLNQLAVTADLSGGNIRNAVLAAAVSARAAERTIVYTDVIGGLANEYRKLGRQMPVDLLRV